MNYSSIDRFPGGDWDWEDHDAWEDGIQHDQLKSNARDEYLTRAYIDGRNAAKDGKDKTNITDLYAYDSLAIVNWELGYDDFQIEQTESEG
jgi:hypothetical protein